MICAGTARQLDLLARDRKLLHFLRTNALETARAWPSWEQSSQFMAAALLAIRREPPPVGPPRALACWRTCAAGIEIYSGHLRERREFARRATALRARDRAGAPQAGPCARLLALRRYRVVQSRSRGRCAR